MRDGILISFEGIKGSGKSTQIHRLAEHLHGLGFQVLTLHGPSAARRQQYRESQPGRSPARLDPTAELLLEAAAHAQQTQEVILPALNAGYAVLAESFFDAAAARAWARGVDLLTISSVQAVATGGLSPNLTFVLDLDVQAAQARQINDWLAASDGEPPSASLDTTFEQDALRTGFLEMALRTRPRARLTWGDSSAEKIHEQIADTVTPVVVERLKLNPSGPQPLGPDDFDGLLQATLALNGRFEPARPVQTH